MSAQATSQKFPWYLSLVFFTLSLAILIIGYLYYENQEAYIKQEKQQGLAAIITLKIDQIISWRQECLDYAGAIMDDPFFTMRVREFLKGWAKPALKKQIIERLTALASYRFQSLALVDPQGNVKVSVPASAPELTPYLKSLTNQVVQTKKIVFSDIYQEENSKAMLSVLTPLLVIQRNEKQVVGVILMRIEPYQFLYPLIKSWPTPSLTGETELVRRDGNEVVFLNELRHRKNIPLNLRLPLNTPDLPEAMFARGKKGIVTGVDYRGVPVLAAAAHVSDSPWFLVAKIDAEEIYAPLKKRSREVGFLLITLIGLAGACVAYFWRNQQIRFYRQEYQAERERRALAQRYEDLTRYANDIILVADQGLNIVEANDKAIDSYGYERHELLKLQLINLYKSGKENFLNNIMQQIETQRGLVFEALQQRKDGTTFPTEVSLRLLEVEGEKLFQEIIRDITERKKAEAKLRESEKNLRQLASQLLRAQEDERKRISLELHDELGHALLALKLQLEAMADQLSPRQISLKKEINKMLSGISTTIEEVRRLYLDLTPGDLEDLGLTTALQSLVDDFAKLQKHIKWTISFEHIDGLYPLPTQIAIYRVVQEALTNIGKHAKPKEVILEIKRKTQEVSFAIKDDGIGFQKDTVLTEKRTLGLLAMEERVKIMGGTFELWSRENQGTSITFTIPISGDK